MAEVMQVQETRQGELAAWQEEPIVALPIVSGVLRCQKSQACRQAVQQKAHRLLH